MILESFKLDGKTAVVTGCKRGIGKAMALALAEAGADIIGVSATLEKQGSKIENEVKSLGKNFKGFSSDFSDRNSLYSFIEKIKSEKIDILINNAGTIKRKPAAEHNDDFWDEVINVNLNAQFILAREIGKEMIKRKKGKIIFTGSLLSFQGGINVPGYAASKGGIKTLIMALSNEWASKGICVNGIAPGYVETDNTKALQKDKIRYNSILERIPKGRWGKSEDFKGPVVFLSSDASDFITGTMITVDGGWMGR